jgi:S1-C subfamily serine protease
MPPNRVGGPPLSSVPWGNPVYALLMLSALPGQFVEDANFSKEMQQTALEATVRIYHPATHAEGSAVIVGRQGQKVYLLTAQHNVRPHPDQGDDVELNLYTAKSYPKLAAEVKAVVRARMPNEDLAVLVAVMPEGPKPLPICPPDRTKLRKPFPVMTVGCIADGPPEIQFDRVTGIKNITKPDGANANYWEADRPQAIGRSGGPLVDTRGYVLGICSGIQHRKGYYTDIYEIHQALKNNGFAFLFEAPARVGR